MNFDIHKLIKTAVEAGASDIHVCHDEPIRLRISNNLREVSSAKADTQGLVEELLKEVPPEDMKALNERLDTANELDFPMSDMGLGVRFRANIYRDQRGTSCTIRIIKDKLLTPEQIGIPHKVLEISKRPSGLFIIAGPGGVGKSTTMASILENLNNETYKHIITIEDPVEYVFTSKKCLINQRQVGMHTKSFVTGLRAAMRQNPDIIVVGEMRDFETTEAALKLAETGHLVLATMHTISSMSIFDRIIGQFEPEEQNQVRIVLADVVAGILTQKLIPKKAGGVIAAFELLVSTDAVRHIIRESKMHMLKSVMQTGAAQGMICMEDHLQILVDRDIISKEIAYAYCPNPDKVF